ncbi:MAG: hypothetical protein IJM05_06915 [Bacteroidales bacterium]|nr:hypothetical protein [Bacteroidales bacterium]
MKALSLKPLALIALVALALSSCTLDLDTPDSDNGTGKRKISFPVKVTRDGQAIPEGAITKTKGDIYESEDRIATMDKSRSFGLVGVDFETGTLILDNEAVGTVSGQYQGFFDKGLWDIPTVVSFSAYYPHVANLIYGDEYATYSIPFSNAETEAGPLVSKTVQSALDQLNMVPLEFQHITNDIGFKICDVTVDPALQGLIHLRKVVATKIASAGIFVNDIQAGDGFWHRRGYYRDELVFEGDAKVGVGMENELFIGRSSLVPRMADSYRFYAIPDEIMMGKQCVEVTYDVEEFTLNGFTYSALTNQKSNYMLYGILPDNVMAYGRQYTFHLGLDTGKLYKEITFDATVSDWETKIYENNDEF